MKNCDSPGVMDKNRALIALTLSGKELGGRIYRSEEIGILSESKNLKNKNWSVLQNGINHIKEKKYELGIS